MATYVFEQMTQDQAAGFLAGDFLVFSSSTASAINVGVTPNAQSGLSVASITLSSGGKSLTFPGSTLTAASISSTNQIIFNDNTRLVLGTSSADTTGYAGFASSDVIYGFGGDDVLGTDSPADGATATAGAGADYLYGGAGGDTLYGGDGNDHIYGNALTTTQGTTDGIDYIFGGRGNDYVQGNAGADIITGGSGNDRLNGGGDGDSIVGGRGQDVVNGNQGNDTIDGGSGNDVLRGGQGNDVITGGADAASVAASTGVDSVAAESGGNDIIYGDLGADTITGGTGFDVLFGGNGSGPDGSANVFVFGAGDATTANIGNGTGSSNIVDIIGDYQDGTDKIDLNAGTASIIDTVILNTTATTFGTVQDALTFAQQRMDATGSATNNTNEVVALNVTVGTTTNAYLFAVSGTTGATIDTVVQLAGVNASVVDVTDFV